MPIAIKRGKKNFDLLVILESRKRNFQRVQLSIQLSELNTSQFIVFTQSSTFRQVRIMEPIGSLVRESATIMNAILLLALRASILASPSRQPNTKLGTMARGK